jgi:tetratricopeptide (TPR) repeat protein
MQAIALIVVSAGMFIISMERLSTFSHPILVWEDAKKLVSGHDELAGAFRIYYNLGSRYLAIKEYDAAIGNFNKSIELFPQESYVYNNLGLAYMGKGDLDQAIHFFTIAIAINSVSSDTEAPRYYYGRANAFERKGVRDAAKSDYAVVCKLTGKACDKAN